MAAAEITDADAIHPGYGFLAENAEFAEICATQPAIMFIGPTRDNIRQMGDKATRARSDDRRPACRSFPAARACSGMRGRP